MFSDRIASDFFYFDCSDQIFCPEIRIRYSDHKTQPNIPFVNIFPNLLDASLTLKFDNFQNTQHLLELNWTLKAIVDWIARAMTMVKQKIRWARMNPRSNGDAQKTFWITMENARDAQKLWWQKLLTVTRWSKTSRSIISTELNNLMNLESKAWIRFHEFFF